MARILGAILIAIGLVGLIWGGLSYTKTEKVIDIGPIEATKKTTERIPITPWAGGIALIGGVALMIAGKRG